MPILVGPATRFTSGYAEGQLVTQQRAVGDFRYVGLFKRVRGTPFAALDGRLRPAAA